MDGRVEGARDHERAELRNGDRQGLLPRKRGCVAQVCGLEYPEEIEGMTRFVAGGGRGSQFPGKRAHRAKPGVLGCRWKSPCVAKRHRAEAPRLAPTAGPHAAIDVQKRDAIDGTAAELVRRAILEVFELVIDLEDADVVRTRRHDRRRTARLTARQREHRSGTGALKKRSSRQTMRVPGSHGRYTPFATTGRSAC